MSFIRALDIEESAWGYCERKELCEKGTHQLK